MESENLANDKTEIRLEKLTRQHNRVSFDCGVQSLNDFLKTVARDDASKGKSSTYIATYDGIEIAGYYTVVPTISRVIQLDSSPRISVAETVVLPGKLAVIPKYRGRDIGEELLLNSMYDCQLIAEQNGARYYVVDALIETKSPKFYSKYSFTELLSASDGRTIPMYMSIDTIRALSLYLPK